MTIRTPGPGIRTRVLLLTSLVLIIAGTTASSLILIRSHLRRQVRDNLEVDLRHSVESFRDQETARLAALERENALMATLPSLKALMTTNDSRTITDDAVDFWKISGNDLFALADADEQVIAVNARNVADTAALKRDLQAIVHDSSKHYLLSAGCLFEYSVRPLYFGSQTTGALLGFVISGFAINHQSMLEIGRGAGAEAAFLSNSRVAVSTLSKLDEAAARNGIVSMPTAASPAIFMLGKERYLTATADLSHWSGQPLQLVVMKSFEAADRAEREINRLLLLVSLLALVAGSGLMLLLAGIVTGPLELLAASARAFGEGKFDHDLPTHGPQEVRYLSGVFAKMRDEIQETNRALLESERLATIGRMASSISHDLRHYLAAVYANSEFLASPALPPSERAELFDEIRLAVNGTTDLLDSLLIFGRTGSALHRVPTSVTTLVERTVAFVRTHPDAAGVTVSVTKCEVDTSASVDTKQMERAIYNLLLNACQSARESTGLRDVHLSIHVENDFVIITVCDSGPGVPEAIRNSLFDPFVSQGKQKGTGLGLTLAWSVAREHDGTVQLVSSRPGETIFRLTVKRHVQVNVRPEKKARNSVVA